MGHIFEKYNLSTDVDQCSSTSACLLLNAFHRSLFGFYIRKVLLFNKMKAKPDVMRPEIMHGLGCSLVLKFPAYDERETTEEEETHVAGLNR